jgi:CubicO group peptidase (beta-lactamase class C family)
MIDDQTRARLDRLLDPWRRSDAPGLILAVGRSGRMEYAAAAGLASLEHGVALRPDHRMAIGSISKHFTAAAVLALQDRGLLSLQDPIGRHVPELSKPQRAPTLDQLLAGCAATSTSRCRAACPRCPLARCWRRSAGRRR